MIEIFLILALISIATIFVNFWSLSEKNEEVGNCFSIAAFFIVIFISAICIAVFNDSGYKSISPLLGHIDKDETKSSEINGEITDLWITVDGQEYHFELKQKENEK